MCKTRWISVEKGGKTVENTVDQKSFPLFHVEKSVDFHTLIHRHRKNLKEYLN